MKRTSVSLAAVAVVAALAALAFRGQTGAAPAAPAKADEDKRTIQTTGSATVLVQPDSARVYFGVISTAQSVKEVRAANAKKVRQVLTAVKALDIPELKMKSTNINVEIIHDRDRNELPKIVGYRIRNSFTVLVQDKDAVVLARNAGRVLDTALASGVNSVQQISFFKQNLEDARRQALSKAVKEARANAEALAAGGDFNLKGIVSISGTPSYNYASNRRMQNTIFAGPAGQDTPLVAGSLQVTCSVNVTCVY